jgi:putative heme uptake system protein
MAERTTWLLVDGENIDATLGGSILRRRPAPDERPRWDRLLTFAREEWGNEARGLFFLNASSHLPMGFVQALVALGYTPVPLSGDADEKIVDIAVQRTLVALRRRHDDVMLVSHDRDFAEDLSSLTGGDRRVGVLAFHEFRSQELSVIPGIELFDLEFDAEAFDVPLDRLRVIPIEEFDPEQFLR